MIPKLRFKSRAFEKLYHATMESLRSHRQKFFSNVNTLGGLFKRHQEYNEDVYTKYLKDLLKGIQEKGMA